MKLLTSFLLASLLGCFAACSAAPDSSSDEPLSNDRAEIMAKPKPSCASLGGACVGLSPFACTDGTWADANEVSCGGATGVGCCIGSPQPPQPPPPPPPSPMGCESAGGQCVGISPTSCPSGRWGDASTFSCGVGIGVGCCLPACPALSPPAPGFCSNGEIKEKKDASGCTVAYECLPHTPPTPCQASGGKCVGISPTACSGTWADAATHPCGAIGVGCCIE